MTTAIRLQTDFHPVHPRPARPAVPRHGAVLYLIFALTASPALAQGTSSQRAACAPDAMRLCAAEIPDAARVTACLRREPSRLGPACRQVMNGSGRPADVVATGSIGRRGGD